jgi:hypothetical protein
MRNRELESSKSSGTPTSIPTSAHPFSNLSHMGKMTTRSHSSISYYYPQFLSNVCVELNDTSVCFSTCAPTRLSVQSNQYEPRTPRIGMKIHLGILKHILRGTFEHLPLPQECIRHHRKIDVLLDFDRSHFRQLVYAANL